MRLLLPVALIVVAGFSAADLAARLSRFWSGEGTLPNRQPIAAKTLRPPMRHSQQSKTGRLFHPRALQSYDAIVQRPLFFHDRRFPKPRPVARPKPPAPVPPRRVAATRPKPSWWNRLDTIEYSLFLPVLLDASSTSRAV